MPFENETSTADDTLYQFTLFSDTPAISVMVQFQGHGDEADDVAQSLWDYLLAWPDIYSGEPDMEHPGPPAASKTNTTGTGWTITADTEPS